jgi:uncharacterized protein YbjT (DUF2867 family)
VSPEPVAVVGAAGKTGTAVTAALLAGGASVRGLVRLGGAAARGAQSAHVDLESGEGLHRALDGCSAVHLAAPNMWPDEPILVEHVVRAMREVGVQRIVYHSVAQPFVPAMPHHVAKAVGEDLVRRSDLAWTVLQPCAYTQNLLSGLLNVLPRIRVPYSPEAPFALIDLADVAAITARVLTEDGHLGATYELGGPEVTTVEHVAEQAGELLGREVQVVTQTPAEWLDAAGPLPDHAVRAMVAMFEYYDQHGLLAGSLVARTLLGRPLSTVREVLVRELTGEQRLSQART